MIQVPYLNFTYSYKNFTLPHTFQWNLLDSKSVTWAKCGGLWWSLAEFAIIPWSLWNQPNCVDLSLAESVGLLLRLRYITFVIKQSYLCRVIS